MGMIGCPARCRGDPMAVGEAERGGHWTDRFISPFEFTVVERGMLKEEVVGRGWVGRN